MSLPLDKKVPLLIQFHEKLFQPGWNFSCMQIYQSIACCLFVDTGGEKDEKILIENFNIVIAAFLSLRPKYILFFPLFPY